MIENSGFFLNTKSLAFRHQEEIEISQIGVKILNKNKWSH